MARPIRVFGDPVLRTPTDEVIDFDESLARLVDDMFASMYAAEGVGLAANQIGVGLSVFVFDCPDASGRAARRARGQPGARLHRRRHRRRRRGLPVGPGPATTRPSAPAYAAVEGVDKNGAPVRYVGDGQLARCLQHETDHLHGLLFVDRLRGRTKRQAMREVLATDWADR